MEKQLQQKEWKKKIILILIFFGFMIVLILFAYSLFNEFNKVTQDIEICKELGYDGAKFSSKWNNDLECSNFTPLERAKRGVSKR